MDEDTMDEIYETLRRFWVDEREGILWSVAGLLAVVVTIFVKLRTMELGFTYGALFVVVPTVCVLLLAVAVYMWLLANRAESDVIQRALMKEDD